MVINFLSKCKLRGIFPSQAVSDDIVITQKNVIVSSCSRIYLISLHCMTLKFEEILKNIINNIQFSSVAQSCPALCDPMNCSMPVLPVHHQLLESTQTHVHWIGDDIQPPHPLSSPSPPALNLSQNQGLFKWVNSSHQVANILEFQLQHQSFQWTPRTDLL